MSDFFASIGDFFASTNIPDQLAEVDVSGLFTNPWFMVPFIALIGYMIYKQAISNLILIGVGVAIWVFSGSSYVEGIYVKDQIQVGKLFPIIGFGVAMIALVVYALFFRND